MEVHLAPVRYDGKIGGLRTVGALELTVHFEVAGRPNRPAASEPHFEAVYRASLANYAQGRQFRLWHVCGSGFSRELKNVHGVRFAAEAAASQWS